MFLASIKEVEEIFVIPNNEHKGRWMKRFYASKATK
jgi:hypothetical protein